MAKPTAVDTYLFALNWMPNTKACFIAAVADRMGLEAWDQMDIEGMGLSADAKVSIEAAMFVAMCDADGLDWKSIDCRIGSAA